ncbi:dephospho-CoA kinase [Planctomycetota bacterium]
MSGLSKKPVIGIVGGIGSGKSTVAQLFSKLGCAVIDADQIAHQVLDEPSIRARTIAAFGDGVLDREGRVDRKKLADIVFTDTAKVDLLNNIIHPVVLERVEMLIERYNTDVAVKAIVLDMPLLVEVQWDKRCDKVVFVDCERGLRAERAKKSQLFGEKQLKIREKFQISLDSKADMADNVVNNNSDLSVLEKQVTDIFTNIGNK